MNDTFVQDVILGEEIEHKVLAIVQKKYPMAYKVKGEFKPYDIYVPENNIKIEVKRDIGSNKSNNYFMEYKCNDKNSGLSSTKADYWVIFDENKYIWLDTYRLQEVAKTFGKKWSGVPDGGCSVVKAFLVPKDIILSYSEKITKPHESSN